MTLIIVCICPFYSLHCLLSLISTPAHLHVFPYSLNCLTSLIISYSISKASYFISIASTFISTMSCFASQFSAGSSVDLTAICFF